MFNRIQLLTIIFCLSCINISFAQDNINLILNQIELANTKELVKYCNKRIDITINQNENNYSTEQAQIILKNFLNGLVNREFELLQKGKTADNTQFIIGTLKSKTNKYKTYILLKNSPTGYLIHDIRFEKD